MITLIIDAFLLILAALMFFKGHYAATRQLSLAPAIIAVLDAVFAGAVDPSLTPVLSGVLVVLQLAVLLGSAAVLRRDAVMTRNKMARRRRRHELEQSRSAFEAAASERYRRAAGKRVCA